MPGILTGVIIGLARAIGETAPIITIGALTFIAFLPPSPVTGRAAVRLLRVADVAVHGDADPDVQLDLAPGGGVPARTPPRRASCWCVMTLAMNGARDLAALPTAKEHQMVSHRLQPATCRRQSTVRRQPAPPHRRPRSKDLNFYYGDFHALKSINMPLYEKQVTALIGPSGCGKSTFLRCFNRMHDLYPGNRYEGEIRAATRTTSTCSRPRSIRSRCACASAWCSRSPTRFPKSIYENVAYGLRVRGESARATLDEKVEEALRDAALWDEVKDRLRRAGVQPLRRPAAAPVHRARAGHRPGDPAVRRADLGARPDRHRQRSRS